MSATDTTKNFLRAVNTAYVPTAEAASVNASAAKSAAILAQAEEQRIANLINLLPHVDRPSKQNILDDLGHLLGIELVQDA